jgi:hypothetical protein
MCRKFPEVCENFSLSAFLCFFERERGACCGVRGYTSVVYALFKNLGGVKPGKVAVQYWLGVLSSNCWNIEDHRNGTSNSKNNRHRIGDSR